MIVGGAGQLGQKLIEVFKRETDWEITSVIRNGIADNRGGEAFDTSSRQAWKRIILHERWRPNVIVNAAAMTDVDKCEVQREEAWRTNVQLVEHLTGMARTIDARFVQLSSDYVFDGMNGPYTETARPNPINYYGKTKLAAENICMRSGVEAAIVRTMWLFGYADNGKQNFVTWLVKQLLTTGIARVVDDEIGNPTLTDDLAYAIVSIIERDLRGIVNLAGPQVMSRFDFARQIAEEYNLDPERVTSIPSAALERAAKRPLQSGLLTFKAQSLMEIKLRSVRESLNIYRTQQKRHAGWR